ncbi:MAG: lipopolysaccharide heptosyltransferase II [Candidatus Omnitrophica bacterium]|nr:lipopolysaccharide heptosyltransferase II [Candidatus Omnitrophota bacterium]MDD5591951.1 lipopolysaccharide heptosyltransferase II [Candidatus Omnitrophota bacterium]
MNSCKFLIINPFGIGDVLFTTPVIRAIKENYPDSIIDYWCNGRVAPVLRNNPRIDMVFALSRGDLKKIYRECIYKGIFRFWDLLFRIRKERFGAALDFSLDHRYGLIAKFAGIKKRIGFNYKKRGRFLTDRIDIDGYSDKHVVEYYLDLLKILAIIPQSRILELFVSEASRAKVKGIFGSYGVKDKDVVIGIAPGAGVSWGQDASLKHWPAKKFAQLADKLIANFGAKIIIIGDESEKPIADTLMNAMREKAIDLTGATTLEDLSAVIDNLAVLVTNDGGPLHMAAALGKKTVSFFGPVDPRVYGPYPVDEKRHIVLRSNLECSPCYVKFHLSGCGNNKECLEAIDVDSALDAVAKLL